MPLPPDDSDYPDQEDEPGPHRIQSVKGLRETELAVLCRIEGEEVWIPKSQILDDSEVWQEGQEGELVITEWLAVEKGLI